MKLLEVAAHTMTNLDMHTQVHCINHHASISHGV